MTKSTKGPLFAEVHNVPDDYHFTEEELDRIIAGDMFTPRQGAIMARELQERRKVNADLTMWVKRLGYSLKRAKPDSKLPGDAMAYLSAKGLISVEDILR
ncbi:hypothetical protein [Pluralibacter gergoviae]|uniref:hypothetical protein n=1 Tax=Pluralibacter gergoviae TaxID=61647 RepID=UPI001F2BFEF6|nr:hypothetical protein [Pluralibacter gergoviae]